MNLFFFSLFLKYAIFTFNFFFINKFILYEEIKKLKKLFCFKIIKIKKKKLLKK